MPRRPFIAVGGGLAGAAFALELARHGEDVLVLESTPAPKHKVCGEFLSAEVQTLLNYLGLDLKALGATSVSTFRLVAGHRTAEAPLPFRGAGLSRFRLDQSLLQAAEAAGAEVRRGVTVSTIAPAGAGLTLKAGGHVLRARGAALATGKHSLRAFPRQPSGMVGFKLQFRLRPEALRALHEVVQIAMFDGGYIGACIVEDELVTLCWVMRPALVRRIGAAWSSQAAYFSAQSERLGDLLADARPEWDKPVAIARIPYGYLRREPIAPTIFPVGDQLAVIPSFTGDGMAIALYSGIAAAHAVLAADSAALFQQRMIKRLRGQLHWAGAVNLLFESRMLHKVSVMGAAALPGAVTWIAKSTRISGFDDVIAAAPEGKAILSV
jgi:flavin-dependent dehydrogenase